MQKSILFLTDVASTLLLANLWLAMITFDYGSPASEQFAEIVVSVFFQPQTSYR